MKVKEIIEEIEKGNVIKVWTKSISIFMEECARQNLNCHIKINITGEISELSNGKDV